GRGHTISEPGRKASVTNRRIDHGQLGAKYSNERTTRLRGRSVMPLARRRRWASMDGMPAARASALAQRVEQWGYGALWLPESRGRNVLVLSSFVLANTKTLTVATGIANIYARDAQATASGQMALAEQSGGRFLLGLGVS